MTILGRETIFLILVALVILGDAKKTKHKGGGRPSSREHKGCIVNSIPLQRSPLCDIDKGTHPATCNSLGLVVGYQRCTSSTTYQECVSANAPPRNTHIHHGKFCCNDPSGAGILEVDDLSECSCAEFPTFVERNDLLGNVLPVNGEANVPNPENHFIKGVAVFDYNDDGFDDIFYIGPDKAVWGHWLFENDGNGSFTDVTVAAGLDFPSDNVGVVAVDLNNDGCIDLVLAGGVSEPGPEFFKNECDKTFTRFTDTANAPADTPLPAFPKLDFLGYSWHISAGDYNNDGFVDLLFTSPGSLFRRIYEDTRLYRNNGNMTFTDISFTAFPFDITGSCVSAFHDFDQDGFVDIYTGECNSPYGASTPLTILHNEGDETFTDVSTALGVGLTNTDTLAYHMALTLGDWNRDCEQDFFTTSIGSSNAPDLINDHVFMIANSGRYEQHSVDIGTSPDTLFGWGSVMIDFDNDGWLDISYVGNNIPFLTQGNPGYIFQSVPCSGNAHCGLIERQAVLRRTLGLELELVAGIAYGDFNNDGWVDLAINNGINDNVASGGDGELRLFMNSGVVCSYKHYIDIGLVGAFGSNSMGIGSNIRVDLADGQSWFAVMTADSSFGCTNSRYVHFGFETSLSTCTICVHWLGSGIMEQFVRAIDGKVLLTEGTGTPI